MKIRRYGKIIVSKGDVTFDGWTVNAELRDTQTPQEFLIDYAIDLLTGHKNLIKLLDGSINVEPEINNCILGCGEIPEIET